MIILKSKKIENGFIVLSKSKSFNTAINFK